MNSFPLAWPDNFPRTRAKQAGRFYTTMDAALANVQTALHRFARDSQKTLDDLVISSNSTPGNRKPKDPGVAIWFRWDNLPICIPIDRYYTVEANLQAIYHVIQARRVELKHGSLELVRATFRGFLLTAPSGRPWWKVLGVDENATAEERRRAYQTLAQKVHPDRKGGSEAKMAELSTAWQQARFL